MNNRYRESGVDTQKAENILIEFGRHLQNRPKNPNVLSGIGPYASCFSLKGLIQEMEDPILVTCCDGVGTKSKLALEWDSLSGLGEDLVAMNVNDLLCLGATPLVFLDYYATGSLTKDQLLPILMSIQSGCERAGCSLVGGETAEMPGLYQDRDFDLAGFVAGVVDRAHILGAEKVKVGDILIAIESSGIHSNGFSLVRKLVAQEGLNPQGLCPFSKVSWRETLLRPTLIYSLALKSLLPLVHGIAHITGEGLLGNIPRVLPQGTKAVLKKEPCSFPPLFQWIQQTGRLTEMEMLGTFNCGIGLVVIAPEQNASKIISHLKTNGLASWVAGKVESHRDSEPQVEWL